MKTLQLVLWRIVKIVIAVVVTYSVLFSFAATIGLIWAGVAVYRPIQAVKTLKTHNPIRTAYMERYLREHPEFDSLQQVFVPFDSIAATLKQAVLAAEDDGFYQHPGFDLSAIAAAYERNKDSHGIRFGGSTITQQVAKNFFLGFERSYQRKVMELVYAELLEYFTGKDRIFELYLNYAQWGPGIFGCEAAAKHYFHKSVSRLSHTDAIRLAAVLARPDFLSPYNTQSTLMQKRVAVIAANLHARDRISDSLYSSVAQTDSNTSTASEPASAETNDIGQGPIQN